MSSSTTTGQRHVVALSPVRLTIRASVLATRVVEHHDYLPTGNESPDPTAGEGRSCILPLAAIRMGNGPPSGAPQEWRFCLVWVTRYIIPIR